MLSGDMQLAYSTKSRMVCGSQRSNTTFEHLQTNAIQVYFQAETLNLRLDEASFQFSEEENPRSIIHRLERPDKNRFHAGAVPSPDIG
jgi:hypothetical protein